MKFPLGWMIWVLIVVGASGCSSSQTSNETGIPLELDSEMESSADPIGSIPEDMLADESSPEVAEPTPDPFADLQEAEPPATDVAPESYGATDAGLSGSFANYEVKPGDTLMKIAFSIYGDINRWKDLYDLNRGNLKAASQLRPGMSLRYEAPLQPFNNQELAHSYLIKQGDTLAGIADEVYGRKMKYKKLQKYNSKLIKNPNRIFAGFTIFYDITPKEMAEAEARRKERMAQQEGGIPSAFTPVDGSSQSPDPIAVSPNSTVPAPASMDAVPLAPLED